MTVLPIASVWTTFGLSASPFQPDPVRPEHALTDDSLFVGRQDDLRAVTNLIASSDRSWSVVQGDPGVGKTSVVNALKGRLTTAGLVWTHDEPILMREGLTPDGFLTYALATLYEIRSRLPLTANGDDRFWDAVKERLDGGDRRSMGATVSVLGVGGGGSHATTRVRPELDGPATVRLFTKAVQSLVDCAGRALLLHVNNLERLSAGDVTRASGILLDLRETLRLRGVHWIFVGGGKLQATVFQPHDQLAGMVPVTRTLQPLTLAEVQELLARRYDLFAVAGVRAIPPVTHDTIATLHSTYRGNLRRFLVLLEGAVIQGTVRGRSLTLDDVLAHVQPTYLAALRDGLGSDETDALLKLREYRGPGNPMEITPTTLRMAGVVNSPPRATEFMKMLERLSVVRFERSEGTSRIYRLAGDAGVALGIVDRTLQQ